MNLELLGCSEKKINQFKKKNINSIEDLVKVMPKDYYDFRKPKYVRELCVDDITAVILRILKIDVYAGKTPTIKIIGVDNHGDSLTILFFNQLFIHNMLAISRTYIFCGRVKETEYRGYTNLIMENPMQFSQNIENLKVIKPIYRKIPQMSDNFFCDNMAKALNLVDKEDYLEPEVVNRFGIISYMDALTCIHRPSTKQDIENAKKRLLFDDIFYFNFILKENQRRLSNHSDYAFKHYDICKRVRQSLPYELTNDQIDVLNTIAIKSKRRERIDAVIQGDVGCGKTIVAILSMCMAIDNGFQSLLLAPTVVLANQHFLEAKQLLEPFGINIALLTSETKKRERSKILKAVEEGTVDILIGTHAVLKDEVLFHRLGIFIVDEEHKFGVEQRDKIYSKGEKGVHCLRMSATPMPRSYAMALYGDNIDVFTIKTLPRGRKPIKTKIVTNSYYGEILTELQKGRQAYIVCPYINADEKGKVQSVEECYKSVSTYFQKYGFVTACIDSKSNDLKETIQAFQQNEISILISTTIIEVGVNIPNATVIVIENAERFGLAQLHQLRGRVGRGTEQSYCLLHSNHEGNERLKTLCESNDGFYITKKDLELRGPGDFIGTVQTGKEKYLMLTIANPDLSKSIKQCINEIFAHGKDVLYRRKMWKDYESHYKES